MQSSEGSTGQESKDSCFEENANMDYSFHALEEIMTGKGEYKLNYCFGSFA